MFLVSVIKGNIGQSVYGVSKVVLIGLGCLLVFEMGCFNICVNCLLSGVIDSDMICDMFVDVLKGLCKQILLCCLGNV